MAHFFEPATLISIAALIVAVLAYALNRKQPNENKIFEEKIRSYHEIIKVLNQSLNDIFATLEEYAENKEKAGEHLAVYADTMHGAIDEAYYAVEDVITNNSLTLPDDVGEKLTAFLKLLDKDEYLEKYNSPKSLNSFDNKTNNEFNKIVDAMRADLEFEQLNKGLKNRLRGNKALRLLKIED